MKYFLLVAVFLLATLLTLSGRPVHVANAADYTIASPAGHQAIRFKLKDGSLYYDVSYRGETILSDSRLSISLEDSDLGKGFQIDDTSTASKNGSWVPVVGSKSSYPDAYNERVIHLSESTGDRRRLDLTFRAYDEGVAFRYSIPKQAALTDFNILSDNSEFQFTNDHFVYWDDYPLR